MTKDKWFKAKFPNIQYKKHPSRKHGLQFDKYFRGSYQVAGKRKMINFGWSSEGWSDSKVWEKINQFKHNTKTGEGPTTLKEEIFQREAEKEEQTRIEKENEIKRKTFASYFDDTYLPSAEKHKRPYTLENEKSIFNKWINPEIGHLPFDKIKPFNLEKIKKNMFDTGRAPRSVQYCFAVFRQVWNSAVINDIAVGDSPTKKVKLPKIENKRLRFLSQEEAADLLKNLKSRSRQTHDMTLLSLHTGVRAGEIFSLTWGVVDFENKSLTIRDSKGELRHVFMTNMLEALFERMYKKQKPSDFVFKDNKGEKIKSISNSFDRVVEELGFNIGVDDRRDKVTFHTCRHTFASWHVQNGTDLYTVKELLGHSTIQLTERYSHLRPDGLKKAAQLFDKRVVNGNPVPLEKC